MAFSNSKPGMTVAGLVILGSGFLIALLLIAIGQSILASLIREKGTGWMGGGGGDCWSLTNGKAVSGETLQVFLRNKNPEFESDIGSAVSGWGVKFNVNPALMVGISRADSSYGTAGAGHRNKNPGNTTISNTSLDNLGVPHRPDRDIAARNFARFDRYGDGYGGLAATFANSKNLYKLETNPLEEILRIWSNGPNGGPLSPSYLATVKEDMGELLKDCVPETGDIAQAAEAEIGHEERRGENQVKYNNWNGQPWCAYFATWVYRKAGHPLNKNGGDGIIPGTLELKDYFQKNEILITGSDNPRAGDIFWMRTGQSSSGYHVGILVKVEGNKFTSVEGNASGDLVEEKRRNLTDIIWLGRLK